MNFKNEYRCEITAVFIDIRKSTALFREGKKNASTPKLIRCFTSETVKILNSGGGEKEIGIRGDCVYGIYPTPKDEDVFEVVEKAIFVNTLIKMLNPLFSDNNLEPLKVGIGIASSSVVAVKAGHEDSGIDDIVWIGEAVAEASNLSFHGRKGKQRDRSIVMSSSTYNRIIDEHVKISGEKVKELFKERILNGNQTYSCNLMNKDMKKWIEDGMKD